MADTDTALAEAPPGTDTGIIDCDIHPAAPTLKALLPYMPEHWQEWLVLRGMHELDTIAYPRNSPLTARPDWRPAEGRPGGSLDLLRRQALDPFGTSIAICNPLYGVQFVHSEEMAAVYATAVNDWMAREWLDREPRLRASIVIPTQDTAMAVAEIERLAPDRRFVQVLMLAMQEAPLGKRRYWPIYEAAARHGLPIGVHAGSTYRHPVSGSGWHSYHIEDVAVQSIGFQSQLTSLISEGVFIKYPTLTFVFIESGFAWLPAHLWRLTKTWTSLRREIPWVDRPPLDLVRRNLRLTAQPFDAPPAADDIDRLMEHMGSDELLLFATDYPHWQFDGAQALPPLLAAGLRRKITIDNPRATYARLQEPLG
jgi:predicted TIM-barrel fold metal-dependent hydrolase